MSRMLLQFLDPDLMEPPMAADFLAPEQQHEEDDEDEEEEDEEGREDDGDLDGYSE